MSVEHDLGPLPDALAALVAAERRAPAAPAADRARVWAAIAAKLPPPDGGPGDAGPDAGPGDGGAIGGGPAPAGAAAAGAATAKAALPWIAGVAGAGAVVAIVVATRTPAPPRPPPGVSAVVAAPPDAAPAPALAPDAPPAALPTAAPTTAAPPPRVTPRAAPDRPAPAREPGSAPVAEDVLIERARISLVRARFDEAIGLLAEHETRFPRGPMRGERELLYVRALLGTSNRAAAEARAARLHAADPHNPSLRAIDAALAR
jgi:hypothetical protein